MGYRVAYRGGRFSKSYSSKRKARKAQKRTRGKGIVKS